MVGNLSDTERDRASAIIATFSAFVYAWLIHDIERASHTQCQLARHGVVVCFKETNESEGAA